MTGSAKQSMLPRSKSGLLRRFAPRNDVKSRYDSAFPRRDAPEVLPEPFAQKIRGRRECRASNAPAASRAERKKRTSVVTTVTPEITRHSPRNGFTAYTVLSPATNSCCHRHRRIKGSSNPVELDFASASLTPATGARTTRLHRTQKAPIILHAADCSRGSSRPAIAMRA